MPITPTTSPVFNPALCRPPANRCACRRTSSRERVFPVRPSMRVGVDAGMEHGPSSSEKRWWKMDCRGSGGDGSSDVYICGISREVWRRYEARRMLLRTGRAIDLRGSGLWARIRGRERSKRGVKYLLMNIRAASLLPDTKCLFALATVGYCSWCMVDGVRVRPTGNRPLPRATALERRSRGTRRIVPGAPAESPETPPLGCLIIT